MKTWAISVEFCWIHKVKVFKICKSARSRSQSNNKRPMGHIAHLRKKFKSLNTYDYIITMIKRNFFLSLRDGKSFTHFCHLQHFSLITSFRFGVKLYVTKIRVEFKLFLFRTILFHCTPLPSFPLLVS